MGILLFLWNWPCTTLPDSIVAQTVNAGGCIHQFAAFNIALIRDCLKDFGAETLSVACSGEPWLVVRSEPSTCFDWTSPTPDSRPPSWHLKVGTRGGRQVKAGVFQCVCLRRNARMYTFQPARVLYSEPTQAVRLKSRVRPARQS
jgi:hypothetical protein